MANNAMFLVCDMINDLVHEVEIERADAATDCSTAMVRNQDPPN